MSKLQDAIAKAKTLQEYIDAYKKSRRARVWCVRARGEGEEVWVSECETEDRMILEIEKFVDKKEEVEVKPVISEEVLVRVEAGRVLRKKLMKAWKGIFSSEVLAKLGSKDIAECIQDTLLCMNVPEVVNKLRDEMFKSKKK